MHEIEDVNHVSEHTCTLQLMAVNYEIIKGRSNTVNTMVMSNLGADI